MEKLEHLNLKENRYFAISLFRFLIPWHLILWKLSEVSYSIYSSNQPVCTTMTCGLFCRAYCRFLSMKEFTEFITVLKSPYYSPSPRNSFRIRSMSFRSCSFYGRSSFSCRWIVRSISV